MATTKTVIKLTPIHCVVAVSGTGAAETIDLSVDLLSQNQTAGIATGSPTVPKVNIGAIQYTINGATPATIVRNNVTLWQLTGAFGHQFNGYSDNRENTSDIVITMPAGGGTVIIELLKVEGYGNTQHKNAPLEP